MEILALCLLTPCLQTHLSILWLLSDTDSAPLTVSLSSCVNSAEPVLGHLHPLPHFCLFALAGPSLPLETSRCSDLKPLTDPAGSCGCQRARLRVFLNHLANRVEEGTTEKGKW